MNSVNLNANDGNQVGSAQKVSILTAEPNTWLLIYSGIAWQKQYAEGSDGFLGIGGDTESTDAVVNVKLDNISGVLLQFATSASLNDIYEEDTWGNWIIWSNTLTLQENGDLILTVNTSVVGGGGGGAGFASFSYYVSAKVVIDVATISGTIRWKKSLAQPLASPHFDITANTQLPPTPGHFGYTYQVEATGIENTIDSTDATFYYVPYTITGPLLGKTITVIVGLFPDKFSGVQHGGRLLVDQISGPRLINLTVANRHATNIDFEMTFEESPR